MTELPVTVDDALRVAIGQADGRRSSTWGIWFGPRDIFAAHRSIAHMRKASIHYPRPPEQPNTFRYIGYTTDYGKKSGLPIGVQDRAGGNIWQGAALGRDYFIEFRFRIPECELRRFIVSDSPRVTATMNCGDGSFAEVELAADFLPKIS
jgi:hypothetical protein